MRSRVLDRAEVATPIGRVLLFAEDGHLVGLEFSDKCDRVAVLRRQIARAIGPFEERAARDAAGAGARLRRYFAGDARALDDQPVTSYGTEFQRRVWRALRRIPAGRTLSYAGLARRIGRPSAVRAVAAANGANPVALFVPCHRVIASDGSPHGYGGGLARKRWLLAHEARSEKIAERPPARRSSDPARVPPPIRSASRAPGRVPRSHGDDVSREAPP